MAIGIDETIERKRGKKIESKGIYRVQRVLVSTICETQQVPLDQHHAAIELLRSLFSLPKPVYMVTQLSLDAALYELAPLQETRL